MVINKTESPTAYRQQLKSRILEAASKEFMREGIKAVKMDDIASKLSISKRTLYEIYENKEQLLMACVQERHRQTDEHMEAYCSNGDHNVIDTLKEFYRWQLVLTPTINPIYFAEVHKYPKVVKWLAGQHRSVEDRSMLFFQKGVAEGFFRSDVNYKLINQLGNACMEYIMKNKLYEDYDMGDLFTNVTMLFIRGFCTPKGIQMLEEGL